MMRAKKSLGQNFLVDPNYRKKIVSAVLASNPQTLLEIGPGKGALTEGLIGQTEKLILIEKDKELAEDLSQRFSCEVINEDFLDVDFSPGQKIIVVGNLPYNAASPILARLMENRSFFSEFFLMFQKEVALRLVAKPGTKDYSLLTLLAQIYSDCSILFHVPPTAFHPRPKVISSVVHFKIKEKPMIDDIEAPFFWKTMRLLFQQRRKTILSVLKRVKEFPRKELDPLIPPHARAEAYSIQELINLTRILRASEESMVYHDLDTLAGTWEDDPAFDEAIRLQHQVDPNLWK